MPLRGSRVRNGQLIPAGVFCIGGIGLLFALIGLVPVSSALPVLLSGQRTSAKVVEVREAQPRIRRSYVVVLEFTRPGATQPEQITFLRKDYRRTARLRLDQVVRIVYMPDDPQRFELLSVSSDWQGGVVALVVGVALLLIVWKAS